MRPVGSFKVMMMAILALFAMSAQAQDAAVVPAPPVDAPVIAKPATANDFAAIQDAFKRYCADPFPNAQGFVQAISDDSSGFNKVEKTPDQRQQPGDQFTNGFISLSYVDGDWMPVNVPSPQCRVSARLNGDFDHLAAAQKLQSALALTQGKSSGRANVNKTIWNLTLPTGEAARIFFDSRPASGGSHDISLNMLRLRNNNTDQ